MSSDHGFTHISDILPEVLKEISRRAELRPRLETEQGHSISDEAFLEIAERDGRKL